MRGFSADGLPSDGGSHFVHHWRIVGASLAWQQGAFSALWVSGGVVGNNLFQQINCFKECSTGQPVHHMQAYMRAVCLQDIVGLGHVTMAASLAGLSTHGLPWQAAFACLL